MAVWMDVYVNQANIQSGSEIAIFLILEHCASNTITDYIPIIHLLLGEDVSKISTDVPYVSAESSIPPTTTISTFSFNFIVAHE